MKDGLVRVVVDFPGAGRRVIAAPDSVISTYDLAEVRGVISAAESAAAAGAFVAGFVSYEAAPAFDSAMQVAAGSTLPLAWFAVLRDSARASGHPDAPAASEPPRVRDWQLTPSTDQLFEQVETIREAIAAGDTYQVNLTARYSGVFDGNPFALYEAMRRAQGAGYHAFIETDEFVIASASPEMFFEVRERHIRTRPMKGTRPRGRWLDEDRHLADELVHSEKDRAENLMIVDLLRNDLGRIADVGTVNVTSLYDVERYRTVHQLTSTVEADLRSDIALVDIFDALFPCGSVTGAPKINTMRIITELEARPREVYCGAVGIIEPGGRALFNVPIRTVWIDRRANAAVYGTGAGITYDSDPAAECAEIISKAAVLLESWPEFDLLETMRCEGGVIVRREAHVGRLMASAAYFGMTADAAAIFRALDDAARASPPTARIRLLVDKCGTVRTEISALQPLLSIQARMAVSPVASTDRFLFHKTTNRLIYERHLSAENGIGDVLLWNERGEVTEFTRGNVVVELDGRKLTPAQHCGLLAGVFRAELLTAGVISEAVITQTEIARATSVWLINSMREWVTVQLVA